MSEIAEDLPDDPPEGFVPYETVAPFSLFNGPMYRKEHEGILWQGFRVQPRHCNALDMAHGGILMTLADTLMGMAAGRGTGHAVVTMQLESDFLASARAGDWVEGYAELTHATLAVAFVRCKIYSGSRLLYTSSGLFRILERRKRR